MELDYWSDESDSGDEIEKKQFKRRVVPAEQAEALETKCDEFGVSSKLPWEETLLITAPIDLSEINPDDEFKREDAFYQQTLAAVMTGEKLLKQHKLPIIRPNDYFAEMVKTDDHMRKVREKMLSDTQKIEASEKARKQRELRKYGKKIQEDVLQKRAQEKRASMEETARHRKNGTQHILSSVMEDFKKSRDAGGDDDFGIGVEAGDDDDRRGKGRGGKVGKGGRPNPKREAKDKKYGFGGKKRFAKSNTKDSTNDMKSFNPSRNKTPFKSGGGAKAGKRNPQAKQARPGKSKRAKQKRN